MSSVRSTSNATVNHSHVSAYTREEQTIIDLNIFKCTALKLVCFGAVVHFSRTKNGKSAHTIDFLYQTHNMELYSYLSTLCIQLQHCFIA